MEGVFLCLGAGWTTGGERVAGEETEEAGEEEEGGGVIFITGEIIVGVLFTVSAYMIPNFNCATMGPISIHNNK